MAQRPQRPVPKQPSVWWFDQPFTQPLSIIIQSKVLCCRIANLNMRVTYRAIESERDECEMPRVLTKRMGGNTVISRHCSRKTNQERCVRNGTSLDNKYTPENEVRLCVANVIRLWVSSTYNRNSAVELPEELQLSQISDPSPP